MRRENRVKVLLYCCFWVLSCTHSASSQAVKNVHTEEKPFIITTFTAYTNSIIHNDNKRMVALSKYVTPLFTDWKYATSDNFTGLVLYKNPTAYVRKVIADSLKKVQEELAEKGLSLLFFDAYRPWSVTHKMWQIVPDERYAANPAKGSGHNRGIAVDVTLAKIDSGEKLAMPTPFDEFSEKAHDDYMLLSKEILENRALLKRIMEKHGFSALPTEWWHFSMANSEGRFELLDINFKTLKKITAADK